MPVIKLEGLWRTYIVGNQEVHAVHDVNLEIIEGEHVAIMGPSGSGKSTMLNILGCLDRPTRGRYFFNEKDAGTLPEKERSRIRRYDIGFVFQFFHLLPRLTALGNVELPMLFAGIPRSLRHEKAQSALESVGLSHRMDHKSEQLSGGERQRVAIARSIVMGPSILLADEPTGNLDSRSASDVMELLETMNSGGLTLIVVTHDESVAVGARRIVRMKDGRVVEDNIRDSSGPVA